jgi:putative ABC transport system ATP-binding protein
MVRPEGLGKCFGDRVLLDRLSLDVQPGEWVAVIGESGSGKSTLLNLVAGLELPDQGKVMVDGADLALLDDDARTLLRRRRIGFVFQAFHILPHLTLAQNVALPLVLLGRPEHERAVAVQAMLDAVDLGTRASSLPRELSGGELQRVAIARALVHTPAVLLADEPTGNLDPQTAAGVLQLLAGAVRARGACGLLVTHSPAAAATCDRVLRLEGGLLVPR